VDKSKRALIITDGAATTLHPAGIIAGSINGNPLFGYSAVIMNAENFNGNDLLPVQAFFLGCELPKPATFYYIEDLLMHINLSGRRCGIFSGDYKALKYLSGLIRSCEAAAGDPLPVKNEGLNGDGIKIWIESILK